MILVTGGAGLLGEELIRQLLAKGETVKALYNKTPLKDFGTDKLIPVSCNILDVVGLEEAMEGVHEVYHCAAMVSFLPSDASQLYKVNVEGTANMVNAAVDAGVQKFCFVSSVAALGRIRQDAVIHEQMQWTKETSNSRYGQSKYLAELEVWRGMAEGLNAVVVNPSIILGAGNWNDGSSAVFKSAYNEFPWYSNGSTGFVDVRDVAEIMIRLMDQQVYAERFIVSAHNATYGDVFRMMAKAFGKKPPHKLINPFIASVVWRIEKIRSLFTGKKPLITKETAKTALATVQFDNSKLFRFLPDFTYRELDQTIRETCKGILEINHNNKA